MLKEISKDKAKAPLLFTSTCAIQSFSDSFFYTGCPYCRKKTPSKEGKCQYCSKTFDEVAYIYTFSVFVADGSGQCWAQTFGDVGEAILGIKAKDLATWEQENNEWQDHPNVVAALNKKFTMKIKKKEDTKGGYKFVVEKILPQGLSEQAVGFLKRLELYYSYLLD